MYFHLPRRALLSALLLVPIMIQARDLPQILRDGIVRNPEIMEALANESVSQAVLEQSRAARYPVVQATASQPMLSTGGGYSFSPGISAQWTLYDFGKLSAQIAADEIETFYQNLKVSETAEQWAFKFAGYYLDAVMAKLQLEAAQDNLALHNHIVDQMRIINQYDPGRRSELTQAESRQKNVEESIVSYRRNLDLNLRRMGRYVQPAVTASELNDPFAQLSPQYLIDTFPMTEEWQRRNSSYLAQEQELLKNEANLKVAQRSIYPNIDIRADANKDNAMVYFNMSVDIFDRKKAPAIRQQEYLIEAARAKISQMADSLSEQSELALIEMDRAAAQIKVIDRQIMALQQVVVDYEDQFKIATRTLLNVVDAYSELATAKQSKVSMQYSLMRAKLDYLVAVGGLTKWAQMTLHRDALLGRTPADADIEQNTHVVIDAQPLEQISRQEARRNDDALARLPESSGQTVFIEQRNIAPATETVVLASQDIEVNASNIQHNAVSMQQIKQTPQSRTGIVVVEPYVAEQPYFSYPRGDYFLPPQVQSTAKEFIQVDESSDVVIHKH